MVVVKRALLSCYDKTGLEAFAKTLVSLGVELIASGGTAQQLTCAGLPVTTVEAFAGITEQLDGRVKTLHPKIHAGILARRDDPAHVSAVGARGLIDLVAVNLYPFEQTIQRAGVSLADAIEQIDVGGVALLRAAAKNFSSVAALSRPEQYAPVSRALTSEHGRIPEALARSLAAQAFALTSAYDRVIADYLDAEPAEGRPAGERTVSVTMRHRQTLRYGENPHQRAAWYVPVDGPRWGLGTLEQLRGKTLSYNNLLDLDAACRCLMEFQPPTCVIVKHHAPCGVASADAAYQAYERAYAGDPESAFGGVVGFNRPLDAPLARRLAETFLEVILAPAADPDAQALFAKKPQVRLVTVTLPGSPPNGVEWRQVSGAWLQQDADIQTLDERALKVVTKRAPGPREQVDGLFAWRIAKHALSNGIVLAAEQATVGIGQGQPSRVGSVRLAIQKAGARSRGAVAASDGFFPFPDSVELLAQAGVRAIIQPGGSIRDAEVIAAADRCNVAMLMTGLRHFRH